MALPLLGLVLEAIHSVQNVSSEIHVFETVRQDFTESIAAPALPFETCT